MATKKGFPVNPKAYEILVANESEFGDANRVAFPGIATVCTITVGNGSLMVRVRLNDDPEAEFWLGEGDVLTLDGMTLTSVDFESWTGSGADDVDVTVIAGCIA